MSSKLIRLGAATAVALGLAFWAGSVREPESTLGDGSSALPGLAEGINDVTVLRLVGAEEKPIVTLRRGDAGWTVEEKDNYPADVAKVREYLLKLSQATLVEPKTANPELHAKLGVEDLAGKEAKGARLELEGLAQPTKLIVGNFNGAGGDGTFVRRPDEDQSWLAKGNLTADKIAANWLQRELADVPSSRIRHVRIVREDKALEVEKTEPTAANFTVLNVPRGRELSSEFVANGLGSVLAGLRFDDVVRAEKAPQPTAGHWDVIYTAFDGLVVSARAWETDGKPYATFVASLDESVASAAIEAEQAKARADYEALKAEAETKAEPPAGAAAPAAGEAPATPAAAPSGESAAKPVATAPEPPLAVADPAKHREERLTALRQEAESLQRRFEGWAFVLPAFKFANMNKGMDDMLKPRESP